MGNPNKDSDGATGDLTSPPGCLPGSTPSQPGEGSQGCHPSQASSRGHGKGDGQAMEDDSEKTKISYFHHWIDIEGMAKIESWKNKKVFISQDDYEKLEENEKEGKYSSEKIESYFTLFELLLAPKSNPLLAVEELCFAKQGSMNSGECHAHVVKIAKRWKFPCAKAEERAIRNTIFLGMNSTWAKDKAINLMNEEGKELTVEFLMQQ